MKLVATFMMPRAGRNTLRHPGENATSSSAQRIISRGKGNRESTASGGDANGNNLRPANYTANNLYPVRYAFKRAKLQLGGILNQGQMHQQRLSHGVNQYVSRDIPGYATVLGSANPNATVTVNLQRAVRQGSYFWDELPENNSSSTLYLSLTNLAVLNNGTNADIVVTNSGNYFLPQTPETFAYDADGNLTNDGRWSYTWNAENRLLGMTANTPVGPQYQLAFAYDYQGRRIQKIVSTNTGSAWLPVYTNQFVYDGWNLIATLNSAFSPQPSAFFIWGSDLSGSSQGAGGVGGLLAVSKISYSQISNSFVAYDANGNVAALVNAANGIVAAQYEYGPFGEVIRATGPMSKANPFRFSTKYQDDETGLNYYGYRYYDPRTGRWLNHDPILERGGINIYAALKNNLISGTDLFGLNAYVINGGGYTGHTSFVIDDPRGGVVIYHFYAEHYHQANAPWWAKDIGVIYDAAYMWPAYYPSLIAYLSDVSKEYGSVFIEAVGVGTLADDKKAIKRLDLEVEMENQGGYYSLLGGNECHRKSAEWFEEYTWGNSKTVPTTGLRPLVINGQLILPPSYFTLTPDFLMMQLPLLNTP